MSLCGFFANKLSTNTSEKNTFYVAFVVLVLMWFQKFDRIFAKKQSTQGCNYWLFNIAMENHLIFKFSKPSISMGHGFHGGLDR